jgi:hypothetical protein
MGEGITCYMTVADGGMKTSAGELCNPAISVI